MAGNLVTGSGLVFQYLEIHSNIIYVIKNKRKKGDLIEIEDDRFYILCEVRDKILYVINVKQIN